VHHRWQYAYDHQHTGDDQEPSGIFTRSACLLNKVHEEYSGEI
jgi:hypothetical protein